MNIRSTFVVSLSAGIFLLSGCASQTDVKGLHDRVIKQETKAVVLEKETEKGQRIFEDEWNKKLAGLSEDILFLRERTASLEGSLNTLTEQIKQETERAEKFRLSTNQELLDFQKGVITRIDSLQNEVESLKKTQAELTGEIKNTTVRCDKVEENQLLLSDRVASFDTGLAGCTQEMTQKISVILEEITRENQALRERIARLEKSVPPKVTSKKSSKKKEDEKEP
ncbi:MAG: hypothetical protein V2A65_06500 [Candidatus Omnitrophota bacterium]